MAVVGQSGAVCCLNPPDFLTTRVALVGTHSECMEYGLSLHVQCPLHTIIILVFPVSCTLFPSDSTLLPPVCPKGNLPYRKLAGTLRLDFTAESPCL